MLASIMDMLQQRSQPADKTAYTYEEVNQRRDILIAPQLAPDPPRQSEVSPRKPARMQAAFFYSHPSQRTNLGPDAGLWLDGSHVVVAKNASWTSSPRGILMTPIPVRRPTMRHDPSSYGAEISEG